MNLVSQGDFVPLCAIKQAIPAYKGRTIQIHNSSFLIPNSTKGGCCHAESV